MSIFDRIKHTFLGTVNDALDSTQNIGTEVRQTVRELDEQILRAENALVEARSQHELLKGKQDTYRAEVDKWQAAAKSAAIRDDALAMECLQKKTTAKTKLDAIEHDMVRFQPTLDTINQQIVAFREQREKIAGQADMMNVRSEVADVQLKTATIMGGIGKIDTNTSLTHLQESLDRKEARAKAASSVMAEKTGESLENRVAALNKPNLQKELADLKAQQ